MFITLFSVTLSNTKSSYVHYILFSGSPPFVKCAALSPLSALLGTNSAKRKTNKLRDIFSDTLYFEENKLASSKLR